MSAQTRNLLDPAPHEEDAGSEHARDVGVRALSEAWRARDIHMLGDAFEYCCLLGVVDQEIRTWYVAAWLRLVAAYKAEGRNWHRNGWLPPTS